MKRHGNECIRIGLGEDSSQSLSHDNGKSAILSVFHLEDEVPEVRLIRAACPEEERGTMQRDGKRRVKKGQKAGQTGWDTDGPADGACGRPEEVRKEAEQGIRNIQWVFAGA